MKKKVSTATKEKPDEFTKIKAGKFTKIKAGKFTKVRFGVGALKKPTGMFDLIAGSHQQESKWIAEAQRLLAERLPLSVIAKKIGKPWRMVASALRRRGKK